MATRPDAPPESWATRLARWGFNHFPAFRGTGGWIRHIAHDWSVVVVEIPLSWRTRNYVATIFGGSMFGACDPIYMLMLIKRLGPEYVVWDRRGTIHFLRPGRQKLTARFTVTDLELATLRELAAPGEPLDRTYEIELVDPAGVVCARIEKTIYVRKKA